jgi:hypothetical protein
VATQWQVVAGTGILCTFLIGALIVWLPPRSDRPSAETQVASLSVAQPEAPPPNPPEPATVTELPAPAPSEHEEATVALTKAPESSSAVEQEAPPAEVQTFQVAIKEPVQRPEPEPVQLPPGNERRCGTAVQFVANPEAAAEQARKEKKLLFVLHVSGNFEDSGFT